MWNLTDLGALGDFIGGIASAVVLFLLWADRRKMQSSYDRDRWYKLLEERKKFLEEGQVNGENGRKALSPLYKIMKLKITEGLSPEEVLARFVSFDHYFRFTEHMLKVSKDYHKGLRLECLDDILNSMDANEKNCFRLFANHFPEVNSLIAEKGQAITQNN